MDKITVNPRLEVIIVLVGKASSRLPVPQSSGLLEEAVRIGISYYLDRLEQATTKVGSQCIAKKKSELQVFNHEAYVKAKVKVRTGQILKTVDSSIESYGRNVLKKIWF